MALFGDANNQILVVDDGGTVDTEDSEALFMTVKTAGTYYAFVDSATAATGGPTATYNLSVSIIPKTNVGVNCTTYTSTDVPKLIGPGAGLVSSTHHGSADDGEDCQHQSFDHRRPRSDGGFGC